MFLTGHPSPASCQIGSVCNNDLVVVFCCVSVPGFTSLNRRGHPCSVLM